MAYLLDTHAFLWFVNGSEELSKSARRAIEDTKELKYISIISFWEISIKLSVKKLNLQIPYKELQIQAIKNGFEILPLTFDHTSAISNLEFHHRDPFDRMIISQAISENLTIIGKDQHFGDYPVRMLW